MSEDPLKEWSRLENENTTHALVSAAYVGMLSRAPQVDAFTTWLLAGTGATAGLLVANVGTISGALSVAGFQLCLSLLAISSLLGLFTKCAAAFFPIDGERQAALQAQSLKILETHGETRKQIEESAKKRGVEAPPDIEIMAVLNEFMRPLPLWAKWFVMLYIKKKQHDRQIGYLLPIRAFMWQTNLCFLQALFFLAFVVAAMCYAG